MTDIVSHDTNGMRDWSQNIEAKSNDYDDLINTFYAIVDEFVCSPHFIGRL